MAKSETWQTIAIIDGGIPPLSGTPTLRIYPVNSVVARQDNAPPPEPTGHHDAGLPPPPPTETSRRLVIPAGASPTLATPALYNNITVLNGTHEIDKLISAIDHNQKALIGGLIAVAVIFALFSCCCCIYCGRQHKKKMDAKKKNMQPTKKGNFTNTSGVSMRQTGGYGNGNGGSRREGSGTDQGLAHRTV